MATLAKCCVAFQQSRSIISRLVVKSIIVYLIWEEILNSS